MATTRAHLVLSAGGVRCLAYIGALEQLTADGYEFESVSACSAGTLVGALLGSGVAPAEMRDAVLSTDLRHLAGTPTFGRRLGGRLGRYADRLGRVWSLRRWPYAHYTEPGIPAFYERLAGPGRCLGDLDPPLAAAAVDIGADRLLVYSSAANPDMPVAELLRITTAVPLMYAPYREAGREIVDAALSWHSPVWLAVSGEDTLPIIVLRTHRVGQEAERRNAAAWISDAISSSVAGRDTFLVERTPGLTVHDIEVDVDAYDFDLGFDDKKALVAAGARAQAAMSDRLREDRLATLRGTDDEAARAELEAHRLLDRRAGTAQPTVFLSYAREDRAVVERARGKMLPLIADPSISVWDDSYIAPGAEWDAAIKNAIARARVAVLFVSASFNASDYIGSSELTAIEDRAASGDLRLLWISLDGATPRSGAAARQAIGDPGRPLERMSRPEQDALLADLAREVERSFAS